MLKTDIDISTETHVMKYGPPVVDGKRIPAECNKAIFVPIHKKGPHEDPRNCRPVSLLSHVRKVVESA